MTVPQIYVAAPYRAATPFDTEKNIHRARQLGAIITALGGYPWIPQSNTAHFDGLAPDEVFLEGTMEMMRRADAVVFAAGWSEGTRAEHAEAHRLRMPMHIQRVVENAESRSGIAVFGDGMIQFDAPDFSAHALRDFVIRLRDRTQEE